MKQGLEKHDKVILSFAIMGLFDGEEEFIRSHFPNIKFIAIQCNVDRLLDRWLIRNTKIAEVAGMTME
jgi:hypothetical protein